MEILIAFPLGALVVLLSVVVLKWLDVVDQVVGAQGWLSMIVPLVFFVWFVGQGVLHWIY